MMVMIFARLSLWGQNETTPNFLIPMPLCTPEDLEQNENCDYLAGWGTFDRFSDATGNDIREDLNNWYRGYTPPAPL